MSAIAGNDGTNGKNVAAAASTVAEIISVHERWPSVGPTAYPPMAPLPLEVDDSGEAVRARLREAREHMANAHRELSLARASMGGADVPSWVTRETVETLLMMEGLIAALGSEVAR